MALKKSQDGNSVNFYGTNFPVLTNISGMNANSYIDSGQGFYIPREVLTFTYASDRGFDQLLGRDGSNGALNWPNLFFNGFGNSNDDGILVYPTSDGWKMSAVDEKSGKVDVNTQRDLSLAEKSSFKEAEDLAKISEHARSTIANNTTTTDTQTKSQNTIEVLGKSVPIISSLDPTNESTKQIINSQTSFYIPCDLLTFTYASDKGLKQWMSFGNANDDGVFVYYDGTTWKMRAYDEEFGTIDVNNEYDLTDVLKSGIGDHAADELVNALLERTMETSSDTPVIPEDNSLKEYGTRIKANLNNLILACDMEDPIKSDINKIIDTIGGVYEAYTKASSGYGYGHPLSQNNSEYITEVGKYQENSATGYCEKARDIQTKMTAFFTDLIFIKDKIQDFENQKSTADDTAVSEILNKVNGSINPETPTTTENSTDTTTTDTTDSIDTESASDSDGSSQSASSSDTSKTGDEQSKIDNTAAVIAAAIATPTLSNLLAALTAASAISDNTEKSKQLESIYQSIINNVPNATAETVDDMKVLRQMYDRIDETSSASAANAKKVILDKMVSCVDGLINKAKSSGSIEDFKNAVDGYNVLPEGNEKKEELNKLNAIAEEYVVKAETSLNESDYNTALEFGNALPASDKKTELLARLTALKEKMENAKNTEENNNSETNTNTNTSHIPYYGGGYAGASTVATSITLDAASGRLGEMKTLNVSDSGESGPLGTIEFKTNEAIVENPDMDDEENEEDLVIDGEKTEWLFEGNQLPDTLIDNLDTSDVSAEQTSAGKTEFIIDGDTEVSGAGMIGGTLGLVGAAEVWNNENAEKLFAKAVKSGKYEDFVKAMEAFEKLPAGERKETLEAKIENYVEALITLACATKLSSDYDKALKYTKLLLASDKKALMEKSLEALFNNSELINDDNLNGENNDTNVYERILQVAIQNPSLAVITQALNLISCMENSSYKDSLIESLTDIALTYIKTAETLNENDLELLATLYNAVKDSDDKKLILDKKLEIVRSLIQNAINSGNSEDYLKAFTAYNLLPESEEKKGLFVNIEEIINNLILEMEQGNNTNNFDKIVSLVSSLPESDYKNELVIRLEGINNKINGYQNINNEITFNDAPIINESLTPEQLLLIVIKTGSYEDIVKLIDALNKMPEGKRKDTLIIKIENYVSTLVVLSLTTFDKNDYEKALQFVNLLPKSDKKAQLQESLSIFEKNPQYIKDESNSLTDSNLGIYERILQTAAQNPSELIITEAIKLINDLDESPRKNELMASITDIIVHYITNKKDINSDDIKLLNMLYGMLKNDADKKIVLDTLLNIVIKVKEGLVNKADINLINSLIEMYKNLSEGEEKNKIFNQIIELIEKLIQNAESSLLQMDYENALKCVELLDECIEKNEFVARLNAINNKMMEKSAENLNSLNKASENSINDNDISDSTNNSLNKLNENLAEEKNKINQVFAIPTVEFVDGEDDNIEDHLPVGTIIKTTSNINVMIIGYNYKNNNKIYDYVACKYPSGIDENNKIVLFNTNQIEEIKYYASNNLMEDDYE